MKPPFVLQNIRVHGLGNVLDSQWIKVGSGITFFDLPEDFNTRGFLRTLQSVNPPHSLANGGIFQNYPKIIRQGKYQKRVNPKKRTVAFAIFIAQPVFVRELAEITPHLYETDRVEVGRRLDYSRWVNFVEIASSTRWSEVDKPLLKLAYLHPESISDGLLAKLSDLEKTDRIEDDLMDSLCQWLERLQKGAENGTSEEIQELLFAVRRQEHFTRAKQLIRERLPYFYMADSKMIAHYVESNQSERNGGTDSILDSMVAGKNGKEFCVLLVDETIEKLEREQKERLRLKMQEASQNFQILYFISENGGATLPEDSTVVRYEDMVSSN